MNCDYLEVLKLAESGRWQEAHERVQPYSDPMACLIHAYLHREEGDQSNARYWYRRAGTDMPGYTLEEELRRLFALAREKND